MAKILLKKATRFEWLSKGLFPCAELPPQDLPNVRFGKLVAKFNVFRLFVTSKVAFAKG